METPNTRSRRKRELMESAPSGGLQEDYGRIDWVHDTRLRRMVLAATQNDEILPPTPTQKPSLTKLSPSNSARPSTSSTSSRPPRKRPCRNRSVPTSSHDPSTPLANAAGRSGSNSAPSKSSGLDSLLRQAMETFHLHPPQMTTSVGSLSEGKSKRQGAIVTSGTDSGLRPATVNTLQTLTATTGGIPPHDSVKPFTFPSKPLAMHAKSSTTSALLSTSARPSVAPAAVPRALQSGAGAAQNGFAPRIGLRTSGEIKAGTHNATRGFKVPLLAVEGARSSPRRSAAAGRSNISAPFPARSPGAGAASPSATSVHLSHHRLSVLPPPVHRRTPVPVPQNAASPCRGSEQERPDPPPPATTKDAPSSDSVGDESFDSFDGIFQNGGAEVEELLKRVDGSQ